MEDVAKGGKTCGLKRTALCRINPCSNLQVVGLQDILQQNWINDYWMESQNY
jgi:hypothetical protein